jgi:hypothetical protein
MFTPKLLAVALAATLSLTACNSSITKPENLGIATTHGPSLTIAYDHATKESEETKKQESDFSVVYSKFDRSTQEITDLEEGDRLQKGDLYKIKITAARDCFVYVFQIDGKGKFFNLIEHGDKRFKFRQLDAEQEIELPKEGSSYELDGTKGMENIFVVVSDKKDPSLEGFYKKLSTKIAQSNKRSSKEVEEVTATEKGPEKGIVLDKTGQRTIYKEVNLEGKVSEQKISCEEQRACESSIAFYNNM